MAQPESNWNPPRGPRNERPRGRGRGPASSHPTPPPSTFQSYNGRRHISTQSPQRRNNPFRYDVQSTPYWDDVTGVIHDIPNAPSRCPAQSYAQAVSGQTHCAGIQQQDCILQVSPQTAFNDPYFDIVGDGPYRQNQAMYTAKGIAEAEAAGGAGKIDRKDFTPYFDAADTRNGADLGSPKKNSFRTALGTKDANLAVRRDATSAIKTAYNGQPAPQTRTTFKSNFEFPTSPKTPKARPVPSDQNPTQQWPNALSPVVEAPSPLKISSKNQPSTKPRHKRTSTLDRIIKLRAKEQAKALAALEGDDNNQAVPVQQDDTSSSEYGSSDDNTPDDEITRLSRAIVGLRPFQDLPSPSRDKTEFERKSAVPVGLDIDKIEAGKGIAEDGDEVQNAQQMPCERTLKEAEADLLTYVGVGDADTDAAKGSVGRPPTKEHSSTESFVTVSSKDYEKIRAEQLETQQNGVKRRWYKGFRKV